jgi:hypothetical protein
MIFGNDYFILDEVLDRFEYGTHISSELPTDVSKYYFKAKYSGTYTITANIRYALVFSSAVNSTIKWYYVFRKNGVLGTPVQAGSTENFSTSIVSGAFITNPIIITTVVDLLVGDEIYIYGELTLSAGRDVTYFPDFDSDLGVPFAPVYTSLEVVANTIFPETTTDALYIHDTFRSIVERITGIPDSFYSEILGREVHGYSDNGCNSAYANMRGLHIRGYRFTEKPFFQSFKDQWDGADPIFNLCLTIEDIIPPEEVPPEGRGFTTDLVSDLILKYYGTV